MFRRNDLAIRGRDEPSALYAPLRMGGWRPDRHFPFGRLWNRP